MSEIIADAQAIAAAGKAFGAQVAPLRKLSVEAEAVQFNSGLAGRDYAAQGSEYQTALLTLISHLLPPMTEKTEWVATTLGTTAHRYRAREHRSASALRTSGRGA